MQQWTYAFSLISLFGNLFGEVHCAVGSLRQVLRHVPVRIACLGDSITAGQPVVESESYPAVLQSHLGNGYLLRNFGKGLATVHLKDQMPTGETLQPYETSVNFQEVLSWKPNIVLVMLGTNDARGARIFGDAFLSSYASLVDKLKANLPTPGIYLCIPPPAYTNYAGGWQLNPNIINEQLPSLVLSATFLNNLPAPLDIFGDFLELCPDPQTHCGLMSDGVHPNAQGYLRIATVIRRVFPASPTAPVGFSGKK